MSISLKLVLVTAVFAQIQLNSAEDTECAICPSTHGIACTGPRTWRYCFGSMIDTEDRECAQGQICTTKFQKWCMPEGGPIGASCSKADECNKCTEFGKNDFACLTKNSFARCMSGKISEEYKGNCPTGYICSVENPDICVSNARAEPTCLN